MALVEDDRQRSAWMPWQPVTLLEADGRGDGEVASLRRPGFQHHVRYHLALPADRVPRALAWLRDLSDGYVRFDRSRPADAKLPGPVVVRNLGELKETGEPASPEGPFVAGPFAQAVLCGPL
jgi:hypothetical protein